MAKTKEELVTMIETELVDPTSNKITGESVKAVLTDIVDAMGTGSGGAMEYWILPADTSEASSSTVLFSFIVKGLWNGSTVIIPTVYAIALGDSFAPSAIAIERNAKTVMPGNDSITTIGDVFDEIGDLTDLGLVQINEETFYTI